MMSRNTIQEVMENGNWHEMRHGGMEMNEYVVSESAEVIYQHTWTAHLFQDDQGPIP